MNIRTINKPLNTLAKIRTSQGKGAKQIASIEKYNAKVEKRYHQLRNRSSTANALVAISNSFSVRKEILTTIARRGRGKLSKPDR